MHQHSRAQSKTKTNRSVLTQIGASRKTYNGNALALPDASRNKFRRTTRPIIRELKKTRVDAFRKLLQPVEAQLEDAEAVVDAEVVADS